MSGIARVITGVSGSPRNLCALREAAALAYNHDAVLVLVLAWVPPGGDTAERQHPSPYLRQEWERAAQERLRDAVDAAFGGMPAGAPAEPLTIRGPAGRVLVRVAGNVGDLLVIGAGRRGATARAMGGHTSRYCLAHAACPVLSVPPSPLELETAHGLRGWTFRHHDPVLGDLTVGQ